MAGKRSRRRKDDPVFYRATVEDWGFRYRFEGGASRLPDGTHRGEHLALELRGEVRAPAGLRYPRLEVTLYPRERAEGAVGEQGGDPDPRLIGGLNASGDTLWAYAFLPAGRFELLATALAAGRVGVVTVEAERLRYRRSPVRAVGFADRLDEEDEVEGQTREAPRGAVAREGEGPGLDWRPPPTSALARAASHARSLARHLEVLGFVDPSIPAPARDPEAFPGGHKRRRRYRLSTALRALEAALAEARSINRDGGAPFFVRRIVLFGSVLRGERQVGDLDLHVEGALRPGADWRQAVEWCRDWDLGRIGFFPHHDWQMAMLRMLRGSSPLPLFSEDPAEHGWPHRVVFSEPGPPAAAWIGW